MRRQTTTTRRGSNEEGGALHVSEAVENEKGGEVLRGLNEREKAKKPKNKRLTKDKHGVKIQTEKRVGPDGLDDCTERKENKQYSPQREEKRRQTCPEGT